VHVFIFNPYLNIIPYLGSLILALPILFIKQKTPTHRSFYGYFSFHNLVAIYFSINRILGTRGSFNSPWCLRNRYPGAYHRLSPALEAGVLAVVSYRINVLLQFLLTFTYIFYNAIHNSFCHFILINWIFEHLLFFGIGNKSNLYNNSRYLQHTP
jgi:hypothetical protein